MQEVRVVREAAVSATTQEKLILSLAITLLASSTSEGRSSTNRIFISPFSGDILKLLGMYFKCPEQSPAIMDPVNKLPAVLTEVKLRDTRQEDITFALASGGILI
jgi:hypothetical protein